MTVSFFVGALLPSMEAGRAGMPLRTTNNITQTGQKKTRRGFSSTPKGHRDPRACSTNQGSPQAKQLCRGHGPNRRGIKIASLFTTESAWKFRYKHRYASSVHNCRPPSWGYLKVSGLEEPWVLETVPGYRFKSQLKPQQRTHPIFHWDSSRA